jgi:hypothetical protein
MVVRIGSSAQTRQRSWRSLDSSHVRVWPDSDVPRCPLLRRCWRASGHRSVQPILQVAQPGPNIGRCAAIKRPRARPSFGILPAHRRYWMSWTFQHRCWAHKIDLTHYLKRSIKLVEEGSASSSGVGKGGSAPPTRTFEQNGLSTKSVVRLTSAQIASDLALNERVRRLPDRLTCGAPPPRAICAYSSRRNS